MDGSSEDVAEYLSSIALELSVMAKRRGFDTADHLFKMAHISLDGADGAESGAKPAGKRAG